MEQNRSTKQRKNIFDISAVEIFFIYISIFYDLFSLLFIVKHGQSDFA